MLNSNKFNELLEDLEGLKTNNDNEVYCIDMYYMGMASGVIYADGNRSNITIEDREDCVLVHNGTMGVLVDYAEIKPYDELC